MKKKLMILRVHWHVFLSRFSSRHARRCGLVGEGATWRAAGEAEGVDPWRAYKYFANLRARTKQELSAAVGGKTDVS